MKKLILILILLGLALPAYAWNRQETVISNVGDKGVTADSVALTTVDKQQLPSQNVYSVTLVGSTDNTSDIRLGDENITNTSFYRLVSGERVTLNVSNMNAIYVSGITVADTLHYIGIKR